MPREAPVTIAALLDCSVMPAPSRRLLSGAGNGSLPRAWQGWHPKKTDGPDRDSLPPGWLQEAKMTIALDHTIIAAKDRWESARFLAGILGLTAGPEWAHFVPVRTGNGVTLDFVDSTDVRSR